LLDSTVGTRFNCWIAVSRTCPDCRNSYDDDVLHCPEDGRGLGDVPVTDELIGRSIGSYRIEKQLGKGGMGSVYMGYHPGIGSKVAIKFLHPQYAHDDKIVDRFFNEARAVNVIGHDNILKILDLNVTEDNRHYFVMEYLQGRAVQNLLKHNVAIPLEVAGPIIMQCCDALEAAHRKGIVHRDLKPDNVYLITMKGKKNFVKVVDFGIARVTDDEGQSTGKTQTGMVMGTPAYMSPEQGSGQTSKIDGRSDIYSLGVMMFQMATGRLPFPGSNFGEVLIGHLQQKPPALRSLKPETPEAYEAIVLKCLEKKQEDRFQSMRELRLAIEACMDSLGISKDLPQADETDPELQPVSAGTRSSPGPRTPGRPTGPGPSNRVSSPGSKPGVRASNPNVRASQPGGKPPTRPGRPPSQPHLSQPPMSMPPTGTRTGLFAGIGAGVLLLVAGLVFMMLRSANQRVDMATREAASRAAKLAAAQAAARQNDEDTSPVFLSVISDPLEADVTATWKDGGEKKGQAPLSFEVPRNTRIHFEFTKSGYAGYSMDVIADQAQNVHAVLKPAPVAVENVVEKKQHHGKKPAEEKKVEAPPSKDGVIDLDDALK
jgi:eukaryotic-like serine/threonine-protein kinase